MDTKQLRQDFKKGRNLEEIIKTVTNWDSKDIYIFLKATATFDNNDKCHKQKQLSIWQSQIICKHFEFLINSDLREDLLHSFFSTPKHINSLFFKLLVKHNPDSFIQHARLSKSFFIEEFVSLYADLSQSRDIKLKNLYKEFRFLQSKNTQWTAIQNTELDKLKHISIEDILIETCSYIEIIKRADFSHTNNASLLVSIRTNMITNLSKLLSNLNTLQDSERYKSISSFKNKLNKELPPINPAKSAIKSIYSPKEIISSNKAKVRYALDILDKKSSFDYTVDNYAAGFIDFEDIYENEAELIQNINFIKHQKNNKKCTYNDVFFLNKGAKIEHNNKDFYNINSALEYWNYLKLPSVHKKVSIEKTLLLLHSFSSWILPLKRQISYNKKEIKSIYHPKVPTPVNFEKLFPRNYINSFEYSELCKSISKYFTWDIKEVEGIINFLSNDILNIHENQKIDLHTRPFIKIGEKIYWMTNLYEDLRWVINLHKRLSIEGIKHNIQTAEIEKSLAEDFNNARINAIASHKYRLKKDSGIITGEIDTLAYKEGYLFVIEIKTTYVEEAPGVKAINHSRTIEGKAKYQLNNAVDYIKSNFDEIRDIEELNIDCKLSDIKIIPLIVTNIFDYESEFTSNNIIRISDFTLKIILKNDLGDMMFINSKVASQHFASNQKFKDFDLPLSSMYSNNRNNTDLNLKNYNFPKSKEECNLWTTPSECSPQDIISAISENKVWGFVDKIWDFKTQNRILI